MTIAFDTTPPRAPRERRANSAPTTASLLNRIEKPPLAERLSADDASINKIPSAPCVASCHTHNIPSYLTLLADGRTRAAPHGPPADRVGVPAPAPAHRAARRR